MDSKHSKNGKIVVAAGQPAVTIKQCGREIPILPAAGAKMEAANRV
ncbi:hypothetical protein H4684_000028 [Desulfomicrobium macestii]|uniref:Uncharacterized protein n=1 Tax=Desulfomicrobium macestii TaxID=90731 RepID=A0ABR9GY71_9BACT|nr:hypothetical protein [Desulfomicrobium macestii]MBE1423409.1 hypothetical protein [Desulfomicrobium macestii]